MSERQTIEPNVEFIQKIQSLGADSVKNCFQCATCSTVCNLSPAAHPFPRKEMIWAQWGLEDRLLGDSDVWLCHQCNDCSTNCPRGAKPGDVLAAIRKYTIEKFSFPGFLGKLVNTRSMLPVLFIIPIVLLLVVLGSTGHLNIPDGEVIYSKFLPVGTLQYFFMSSSMFAVLMFLISISRFWRTMNHNSIKLTHQENKQGLIPAFFATVIEIITHKKFADCGENKTRQIAHLLTFYGFISLAVTAGLGAFYEIILHSPSPYHLLHPVKIIGNAGAFIFLIGSTILVVRRVQGNEKAGNSTYADWLFMFDLYAIGITGILLELFRLSGIAGLAYPTYFIHLVCIFVLLVFAPYSKFAHVGYRFVALLWARINGRGQPAALLVSDILVQNSNTETPIEEPAKEVEAVN
jgi:quinone-modifying oxidoreductase subunit QmoC